MTCPRCGSNQIDEVKFCTVCGANLHAVRQALELREPDEKFSWNNTWLAEMFLSAHEQEKRRGITPEVKRYNEIKAGVITGSVGVAVSIFLYVFMQGLILNSHVTHDAAVILSNVWVVGVIPTFIGLALITNGLVVSKKLVEISKRDAAKNLEGEGQQPSLRAANTNEFASSPFSVTEDATKHLQSTERSNVVK